MAKNPVLRTSDTKIVVSDSLLSAVLVGFGLYSLHVMHPFFCFLIAFLVAAALTIFFFTKIGYWIVTLLYSIAWAILWALIAGALSENHPVLEWAVGIIAFVCSIFLHRAAKRFHDIVSDDK